MTSIPSATCRIYRNIFKRYYLRNIRFFLDFLLHIWTVHEIYTILKKKMSILAWLFPNLLMPKHVPT